MSKRLVAVAGVTLAALACVSLVHGPRRRETPADPTRCNARIGRSDLLHLSDSTVAYVEPMALAANAKDEVLLAGRVVMAFDSGASGWRPRSLPPAMGVIVDPSRTARLVSEPVPGKLAVVRAIGVGSRWHVAFALARDTTDGLSSRGSELYVADYDGDRWSHLERLPNPQGVLFQADLASDLVSIGDTLYWALGAISGTEVFVYKRFPSGATVERIARPNAATSLGRARAGGLVAAMIGGTVETGGNSLLLARRGARWSAPRVIVPGVQETVYRSTLSTDSIDPVLSWLSETAQRDSNAMMVRALAHPLQQRYEDAVTIDSSAAFLARLGVLDWAIGPTWVTEHLGRDGDREIRVTAYDRRQRILSLARLSSPYHAGVLQSTVLASDRAIVSGLVVPQSHAYMASLQMWFTLQCVSDASGTHQ